MTTDVTVTITVKVPIALDHYVDPDEHDYPYDEQIADEIVNSLADGDDVWSDLLSDGDVSVTVHD